MFDEPVSRSRRIDVLISFIPRRQGSGLLGPYLGRYKSGDGEAVYVEPLTSYQLEQ